MSLRCKINILDFKTIAIGTLLLIATQYFQWWSNGNIKFFDFFLLPIFFIIYLFFKKKFIFIYFIIFAILSINLHGIKPIISTILIYLVSFSFGNFFLSRFLKNNQNFFSFQSLGIGFAIVSTTIFFLSFFKINTIGFYILIFVIPSILYIFKKKNDLIKNKLSFDIFESDKFLAFFSIYVLNYYLASSLIPELSHDALSHHLTIPSQLNFNTSWSYNVYDFIWAVLPQGTQWIFSFIYFFGGVFGVKLFCSSIPIVLSIYIYSELKDKFGNIIEVNYLKYLSLLILSLPINLYLVRGMFVDLFHAFVVTLIFFLLFEKNLKIKWIKISLLLGFAFAIKSSTIIILTFILPIYLYDFVRCEKKNIFFHNFFPCLILFLLLGCTPYLVAFLKTGSPTFPLYNEIFKSSLLSSDAFYHPLYSKSSLLDFIFTSLNSKNYGEFRENGALGLVLLFFGIYGLFNILKIKDFFSLNKLNKLIIIIFLGSIFSCAIMFSFQAYVRYIYILVPILVITLFIFYFQSNNDHTQLKKIFIFLILINCLKFDKITSELPDIKKIYIQKNENEKFYNFQYPLKKVSEYINNNKNFENKKIAIISHNNDPAFFFFKNVVAFHSWHSFSFFKSNIETGDLQKSLKKLKYNFIIYKTKHNTSFFKNHFQGHPKNFSTPIKRINGFIVAKINIDE